MHFSGWVAIFISCVSRRGQAMTEAGSSLMAWRGTLQANRRGYLFLSLGSHSIINGISDQCFEIGTVPTFNCSIGKACLVDRRR